MARPAADQNSLLEKASQIISQASYCVALTGAGISTPSGIPDFRSPGSGVWTKYSPMEVATLQAFRYHPERFYDWLRPFAATLFQANPNPAHLALARLEGARRLRSIITQNIDALHQQAGSEVVIEVHGSMRTLTCPCCFREVRSNPELLKNYLEDGLNPTCENCDSLLKPDIILYQEQLPAAAWNQARKEISACDVLIVLGSSLTVVPVCDLPYLALGTGAKLIILNHSPTHLDSQAAVCLRGDVAELLPEITSKVLDEKD